MPHGPLLPPPKVLEPVFLQFEILGTGSAPKAPKSFLGPSLGGIMFLTLCVHTQNSQNFVENSKMFEKHTRLLTSDVSSGSDLGGYEPEPMSSFFPKNLFAPLMHVQNDQRVMGIILRYACWVPTHAPLGTRAAERPSHLRPPPLVGSFSTHHKVSILAVGCYPLSGDQENGPKNAWSLHCPPV